jgi:hypothetical protein
LFPFLKASLWIFSSDDGLVSSGENPSFGLPERATAASASYPSCGRRLGEPALIVVRDFSCVGVGGRRGSGPGWWMCVEAAASGFMVSSCFMRRSSCLHGLGDCLVSLVRRGCRLGRRCLSGDRLTFRPGQWPRMLVRRPWSTNSLPFAAWAAGGWVVRRCGSSSSGVALGRRSQKEVLLFGEAAPKGVHRDLVSSGRRGLLDAGCWRRVTLEG